jgi:cytochrome P450
MWKGDGNLLELLPAAAYHFDVGNLGYSRRSTVLFNQPEAVREIMRDADGVFPKSDLMVSALEHLIGDSIFVTDGERWKRQRAMIDPAFSHMRISHAFGAMKAGGRRPLDDTARKGGCRRGVFSRSCNEPS